MNLLLNVLWMILGGGLLIWLEYVLAGLLLCLTIVGIPFGVQCFKIAGLGLLPFGATWVEPAKTRPVGCLLNVVWMIVGGIWIFISHVVLAVGLAVTLIGIPFALQHLKLAMVALMPFGKTVRRP
ncbi:MAG: YccF domain-containing protein [Myxococcales bacterium]